MNKKRGNSKLPCIEHRDKIEKLEDEHNSFLVAYTGQMTELKTLFGALKESNETAHKTILEKIAEFSNGR